VTLAQLLLNCVLLLEAIPVTLPGVPKGESGFVHDGNFVAVLKDAAFVAANKCVIDKGTVPGKIFDDGDGGSIFVFGEDEAVPIGDCREVKDAVYPN
jgi:hypothetical protein